MLYKIKSNISTKQHFLSIYPPRRPLGQLQRDIDQENLLLKNTQKIYESTAAKPLSLSPKKIFSLN